MNLNEQLQQAYQAGRRQSLSEQMIPRQWQMPDWPLPSPLFSNGNPVYPPGTVLWPNGTIIHPDGTTLYPNGTVTYPNGAVKLPDGTLILPKGDGTNTVLWGRYYLDP